MVPPRRVSIGRQRIDIRRIESEEARQVCFSKRRSGLFNKVSDLSTLCGAQVAAVVFSPAGKVFSLGQPSVDSVLNRFIADSPPEVSEDQRSILEELNNKCGELQAQLEKDKVNKDKWNERLAAVRAENSRVAAWIEEDVKEEDVADYRAALMNVQQYVKARADEVLRNALVNGRAPAPPMPFAADMSTQLNDFQIAASGTMLVGVPPPGYY